MIHRQFNNGKGVSGQIEKSRPLNGIDQYVITCAGSIASHDLPFAATLNNDGGGSRRGISKSACYGNAGAAGVVRCDQNRSILNPVVEARSGFATAVSQNLP